MASLRCSAGALAARSGPVAGNGKPLAGASRHRSPENRYQRSCSSGHLATVSLNRRKAPQPSMAIESRSARSGSLTPAMKSPCPGSPRQSLRPHVEPAVAVLEVWRLLLGFLGVLHGRPRHTRRSGGRPPTASTGPAFEQRRELLQVDSQDLERLSGGLWPSATSSSPPAPRRRPSSVAQRHHTTLR